MLSYMRGAWSLIIACYDVWKSLQMKDFRSAHEWPTGKIGDGPPQSLERTEAKFMCGIAGFHLLPDHRLATDQARRVVRSMCDSIVHRGPDDSGDRIDGGCGIGMRRLSIIDLSTGHQPMSNEDRTMWIVFNGEIYNFANLRTLLENQGHRFTTPSDTETILHLYEQEGVDGFGKLDGMFAFAIWDGRARELILARDRFGKKPLYYTQRPEGLYFGSELKCLRAAGVPLTADPESLRPYFWFGYMPEPGTPFAGVEKLVPGGWMVHGDSGKVRQGRFWSMPVPAESAAITEKAAPPEAETARLVRQAVENAVRDRLVADVPLGAFLSGGIDSSAVVAIMARLTKEPVKTFTIGFEESEFNELDFAREVANKYHTDHHEILVRPDMIGLVNRIVRHLDEPLADSAVIPTLVMSDFAAQHVKVALTGDGGDEFFGGYRSFFNIQAHRRFDRIPGPVRSLIGSAASLLPYSSYGKNFLRMISRPSAIERYFENNYTPYFLRQRLLSPAWMTDDCAFLRSRMAQYLLPENTDVLTQAMYFESTANLTCGMLVKVDRMSMAASLEVRCPLLDHRLVELAASLPPELKIRDGKGKYILIQAVRDYLPASLLSRKKMGFGVPLKHWFRTSLKDFLTDHLLSARSRQRGVTSPGFVAQLIEEHRTGRRDNSQWLWTLLMLELWFLQLEASS